MDWTLIAIVVAAVVGMLATTWQVERSMRRGHERAMEVLDRPTVHATYAPPGMGISISVQGTDGSDVGDHLDRAVRAAMRPEADDKVGYAARG